MFTLSYYNVIVFLFTLIVVGTCYCIIINFILFLLFVVFQIIVCIVFYLFFIISLYNNYSASINYFITYY